jgi:LAS superfamily LD-carboxypeptidase LdcB
MYKVTLLLLFLFQLPSCSNPEGKTSSENPETVVQAVYENESEESEPVQENEFDLDYIMGKFDPAKHPDFVKIDTKYADREGLYLRKDTYESFIKMWEAAKADGINLTIKSATRNFDYQKGIWERKWTGETKIESGKDASKVYPFGKDRALAILKYSSMPSTSRHHWGTDIDINNFENSYFEKGQGLKEYEWLTANAPEYGFCQVYSPKGDDRPYGYELENWHWSYLPVAKKLTQLAKEKMKDSMIEGFQGAEDAPEIGVVEKYILGINPVCM